MNIVERAGLAFLVSLWAVGCGSHDINPRVDSTTAPATVLLQATTDAPLPATLNGPLPSATRIEFPTVHPTSTSTLLAPTPVPPGEAALYQLACAFGDCEYSVWEFDPLQRLYERTAAYLSAEPGSATSPAYATELAYAHFADLVAYWIEGEVGELWISDLAVTNPRRVFADTHGQYASAATNDSRITLLWTPDDRHVIIGYVAGGEVGPQLIYSVESGQLAAWHWECDRVVASRQTNRFDTWCASKTRSGGYAVLEWGGAIRHSPTDPEHEIIRGSRLSLSGHVPVQNQPWALSPDGQSIAYFKPGGANATLHIAGVIGNEIQTLPGGGRYLRPGSYFVPGYLQWSQDGTTILVNAFGTELHPCPMVPAEADGSGPLREAPCWQALDAQSGRVRWTLLDAADGVMARIGEPVASIGNWLPTAASVSPDGQLVALRMASGGVSFGVIVEIASGQVYDFDPAGILRWGSRP